MGKIAIPKSGQDFLDRLRDLQVAMRGLALT